MTSANVGDNYQSMKTGDEFVNAGGVVEWAKMPLDQALERLRATRQGLTQAEAEKRYIEFGPNKLPEEKVNPWLVFLSFMWNPLSWAMELAAVLAIIVLDYADFILILFLLILNAVIGFYEEMQAGNAVAALMDQLAPEAKCIRDGNFVNIPADHLVPGDVIRIRLGDVVPADLKLLEGDEVKIDQSSLTGESLPVTKRTGDEAFSGSVVKQGEIESVVTETGVHTFLGRAATLMAGSESKGRLQEVLTTVGNFCLITIELAVQFGAFKTQNPCALVPSGCEAVENILVVIIGGIPVAMPTVLSVTMAIGCTLLAKQSAIVTRMTAVEEMASMEILCSDKTGTLTLNQLTVDKDNLVPFNGYPADQIIRDGALAARLENNEPIDVCIFNSCDEKDTLWENYTLLHYTPFDPVSKRTIAKIKDNKTGKVFRCCKGAPQIILEMDEKCEELKKECEAHIDEFASRGYRALGTGRDDSGDVPLDQCKWKLVGILPLFDPPRHDTADTIKRAIALGVGVKMVTGDHRPIAIETARQLGMPTNILDTAFFNTGIPVGVSLPDLIYNADGFAQVFPEHKFEIVRQLQLRGHVVGMTGDGVNDAPALSQANIGIAVDDATDAARAAADIVLVSPGLSVIITAINGSREIFQRMKNYAMYSIAMTIRICFSFGLLTVIWNWYFPTILIIVFAILNDGTIMTISKDDVIPSPEPDSWKLTEIFFCSINYGLYLTISTVIFFYIIHDTTFFWGITNTLDNFCINCQKSQCQNYPLLNTAPNSFSAPSTAGSISTFNSCCSQQNQIMAGILPTNVDTTLFAKGSSSCTASVCANLINLQINQYINNVYNVNNKYSFSSMLNNGDYSPFTKYLTNLNFEVYTTYQAQMFQSFYNGSVQNTTACQQCQADGNCNSGVVTPNTNVAPQNAVCVVDQSNTNGVSYCNWLWGYSAWYPAGFNIQRGGTTYETIGPAIQVAEAHLRGIIYMQVSISGQALIFVTRTSGANCWFFQDKPANILLFAFVFAQTVATIIGALGFLGYPSPRESFLGCGGNWLVVVWIWVFIWHFPLDLVKFFSNYVLHHGSRTYTSNKAGDAFTRAASNRRSVAGSRRAISNRERAIRASRTV